jgi:hypothetical protein
MERSRWLTVDRIYAEELMRALLLCALLGGVVGVGLFACNPNSIGRPCINPGGQAVGGTQISSPALECPSRLCLIQPANASTGNTGAGDGGAAYRATCTAGCNSNSDCSPETNAQCQDAAGNPLGFVCAVATTGGPFCCRKICICRGDLVQGVNVDPDGGVVTPFVCNAANGSTCPNAIK